MDIPRRAFAVRNQNRDALKSASRPRQCEWLSPVDRRNGVPIRHIEAFRKVDRNVEGSYLRPAVAGKRVEPRCVGVRWHHSVRKPKFADGQTGRQARTAELQGYAG